MNRTLLPKPTGPQLEILASLSPEIEERAASRAGRGLVVVRIDEARASLVFGFTPAGCVDVPHVMAMELPEEAAVEVVRSVEEDDEAEGAPVLLLDRKAGGLFEYAYALLGARAGAAGR